MDRMAGLNLSACFLAAAAGVTIKVSVVYGSFTTPTVVLLSLEVAATLLLGAQVIAECESIETGVEE